MLAQSVPYPSAVCSNIYRRVNMMIDGDKFLSDVWDESACGVSNCFGVSLYADALAIHTMATSAGLQSRIAKNEPGWLVTFS